MTTSQLPGRLCQPESAGQWPPWVRNKLGWCEKHYKKTQNAVGEIHKGWKVRGLEFMKKNSIPSPSVMGEAEGLHAKHNIIWFVSSLLSSMWKRDGRGRIRKSRRQVRKLLQQLRQTIPMVWSEWEYQQWREIDTNMGVKESVGSKMTQGMLPYLMGYLWGGNTREGTG